MTILGLVYSSKNKLLAAKNCFEKVLEVQTDSSFAYHNLGHSREKRGLGSLLSFGIPLIQAVFRVGGKLLNSHFRNQFQNGMKNVLPQKFNPTFDKSINSLNRSISVRRANTAYQAKLVNTIELLQMQLKHSVATRYISDDILKTMEMQHALTAQSI